MMTGSMTPSLSSQSLKVRRGSDATRYFPAPTAADCMQYLKALVVMLSETKHLVFTGGYQDEIPRLRLGMTQRHSPLGRKGEGLIIVLSWACWARPMDNEQVLHGTASRRVIVWACAPLKNGRAK
jgi:hypothetical protein